MSTKWKFTSFVTVWNLRKKNISNNKIDYTAVNVNCSILFCHISVWGSKMTEFYWNLYNCWHDSKFILQNRIIIQIDKTHLLWLNQLLWVLWMWPQSFFQILYDPTSTFMDWVHTWAILCMSLHRMKCKNISIKNHQCTMTCKMKKSSIIKHEDCQTGRHDPHHHIAEVDKYKMLKESTTGLCFTKISQHLSIEHHEKVNLKCHKNKSFNCTRNHQMSTECIRAPPVLFIVHDIDHKHPTLKAINQQPPSHQNIQDTPLSNDYILYEMIWIVLSLLIGWATICRLGQSNANAKLAWKLQTEEDKKHKHKSKPRQTLSIVGLEPTPLEVKSHYS